ncbi:unnamed protein product, partial [Polarella glacialis]
MANPSAFSERESFVLCDSRQRGFPISYASAGFQKLFGYDEKECLGTQCGALVGYPSILTQGLPCLSKEAAAAGLTVAEAVESLEFITSQAGKLALKVSACEADEFVGPMLLVNRRKSGELFVCEMGLQ